MKPTLILSFLLLFGLTGCNKNNSEVDPRVQYIGTFAIKYVSTTTVGSGTDPVGNDSGEGTITFSQGNANDELVTVINFPGYSDTEIAKVNGSQFTLNKTRNTLWFNGQSYDGEYVATGTISGRNLTINATTRAIVGGTVGGTQVIWTQTYQGVKQ